MKFIYLKNICFKYTDKPVLNNISFKINKGDFVGIIGLSGAGKSTLADVIMGLLPVDSGKILVDPQGLKYEALVLYAQALGLINGCFLCARFFSSPRSSS